MSAVLKAVDNGVNVEALLGARAALTEAPEAARFVWRAESEWQNGTHTQSSVKGFFGLGEEQNHVREYSYDTDHPEVFASEDKGSTPVEFVLVGLAGCLTAGIAAVAQNRAIQLNSVKATLNRYLRNVRQRKNQILESAETPLGGIRAVLHGFIDMSEETSDCPQGCMAVKTLVEMAPHDAEVQRIMDEHKDNMRASMVSRVAQAQTDGQLGTDKSPEMITSLIMIFMDGLAAQATGPMNVDQAHAVLDAQLDAVF